MESNVDVKIQTKDGRRPFAQPLTKVIHKLLKNPWNQVLTGMFKKKKETLFTKFLIINRGKARIISAGCGYLINPNTDSKDNSRSWALL